MPAWTGMITFTGSNGPICALFLIINVRVLAGHVEVHTAANLLPVWPRTSPMLARSMPVNPGRNKLTMSPLFIGALAMNVKDKFAGCPALIGSISIVGRLAKVAFPRVFTGVTISDSYLVLIARERSFEFFGTPIFGVKSPADKVSLSAEPPGARPAIWKVRLPLELLHVADMLKSQGLL